LYRRVFGRYSCSMRTHRATTGSSPGSALRRTRYCPVDYVFARPAQMQRCKSSRTLQGNTAPIVSTRLKIPSRMSGRTRFRESIRADRRFYIGMMKSAPTGLDFSRNIPNYRRCLSAVQLWFWRWSASADRPEPYARVIARSDLPNARLNRAADFVFWRVDRIRWAAWSHSHLRPDVLPIHGRFPDLCWLA